MWVGFYMTYIIQCIINSYWIYVGSAIGIGAIYPIVGTCVSSYFYICLKSHAEAGAIAGIFGDPLRAANAQVVVYQQPGMVVQQVQPGVYQQQPGAMQ